MDAEQQRAAQDKETGEILGMGCFALVLVILAVLYFGFGVRNFGEIAFGIAKGIGAVFLIASVVALVVGPFMRMNDPDVHRGQVPGWQWQEWHENGGGPFSSDPP